MTTATGGTPGWLSPETTIEDDLDAYNWDAWFCAHSHGYAYMPSPSEAGYYIEESTVADIDGDTRSGTWDIGADEYIAAGGLSIPVAMRHYRNLRNN